METTRLSSVQQRIKSRRIELGLTYQELADKTGMSKSTLQRYETGFIKNLPLDRLWILSEALETTPNWILSIDTADDLPKQQYDIFLDNMNFLMKKLRINYRKLSSLSDLPASLIKSIMDRDIVVSTKALSLIAEGLGTNLALMLNPNCYHYTEQQYKINLKLKELNTEGQEKVLTYLECLISSQKYHA